MEKEEKIYEKYMEHKFDNIIGIFDGRERWQNT